MRFARPLQLAPSAAGAMRHRCMTGPTGPLAVHAWRSTGAEERRARRPATWNRPTSAGPSGFSGPLTWTERLTSCRIVSPYAAAEIAALCMEQEGRHHFAFYRPGVTTAGSKGSTPADFVHLLHVLAAHPSPETAQWASQVAALLFEILNKPIHPQTGSASVWDLPAMRVHELKQETITAVAQMLNGDEALRWLIQILGVSVEAQQNISDGSPGEACAVVGAALLQRFYPPSGPAAGPGAPVRFTDPHGADLLYSTETVSCALAAMFQIAHPSSTYSALNILDKIAMARLASPNPHRVARLPPVDVRDIAAHCAEVAAQRGDSEAVARLIFLVCRSEGALGMQSLQPADGPAAPSDPTSLGSRLASVFRSWRQRLGAAPKGPAEHWEEWQSVSTRLLKSAVHAALSPASPLHEAARLREAVELFLALADGAAWAGVAAMAVELLSFTAAEQQQHFNAIAGRECSTPAGDSAATADLTVMRELAGDAVRVFEVLQSKWPEGIKTAGQRTVAATCAELLFRSLTGLAHCSGGAANAEAPVICFPFCVPAPISWMTNPPAADRRTLDIDIPHYIQLAFCSLALEASHSQGEGEHLAALQPYVSLASAEEHFVERPSSSFATASSLSVAQPWAVTGRTAFLSQAPPDDRSAAMGVLALYGCLCDAAVGASSEAPLAHWLGVAHQDYRQALWAFLRQQPPSLCGERAAGPRREQLTSALYVALEQAGLGFLAPPGGRTEALELLDLLYFRGCPHEKQLTTVVDLVYRYAVGATVWTTALEELAAGAGAVVVVTVSALAALAAPNAVSLGGMASSIRSLLPATLAASGGGVTFALTRESALWLFSETEKRTVAPGLQGVRENLLNHATEDRVALLPPLARSHSGIKAAERPGAVAACYHVAETLARCCPHERRPMVLLWCETGGADPTAEQVLGSGLDARGVRLVSIRRAQMSKAQRDIRAVCQTTSHRSGASPISLPKRSPQQMGIKTAASASSQHYTSPDSLLRTIAAARKRRS